jgi:hypothetical protein
MVYEAADGHHIQIRKDVRILKNILCQIFGPEMAELFKVVFVGQESVWRAALLDL